MPFGKFVSKSLQHIQHSHSTNTQLWLTWWVLFNPTSDRPVKWRMIFHKFRIIGGRPTDIFNDLFKHLLNSGNSLTSGDKLSAIAAWISSNIDMFPWYLVTHSIQRWLSEITKVYTNQWLYLFESGLHNLGLLWKRRWFNNMQAAFVNACPKQQQLAIGCVCVSRCAGVCVSKRIIHPRKQYRRLSAVFLVR